MGDSALPGVAHGHTRRCTLSPNGEFQLARVSLLWVDSLESLVLPKDAVAGAVGAFASEAGGGVKQCYVLKRAHILVEYIDAQAPVCCTAGRLRYLGLVDRSIEGFSARLNSTYFNN